MKAVLHDVDHLVGAIKRAKMGMSFNEDGSFDRWIDNRDALDIIDEFLRLA